MGRACGAPNEIKKNNGSKTFTALFRVQAARKNDKVSLFVGDRFAAAPSLCSTLNCRVKKGYPNHRCREYNVPGLPCKKRGVCLYYPDSPCKKGVLTTGGVNIHVCKLGLFAAIVLR